MQKQFLYIPAIVGGYSENIDVTTQTSSIPNTGRNQNYKSPTHRCPASPKACFLSLRQKRKKSIQPTQLKDRQTSVNYQVLDNTNNKKKEAMIVKYEQNETLLDQIFKPSLEVPEYYQYVYECERSILFSFEDDFQQRNPKKITNLSKSIDHQWLIINNDIRMLRMHNFHSPKNDQQTAQYTKAYLQTEQESSSNPYTHRRQKNILANRLERKNRFIQRNMDLKKLLDTSFLSSLAFNTDVDEQDYEYYEYYLPQTTKYESQRSRKRNFQTKFHTEQ